MWRKATLWGDHLCRRWQEQLDLCLMGIMATFGWEKALGDSGELDWWQHHVLRAAERCGIPPSR